jgi:RNase P/RNase MRP subunit p29
MSGINIGDKVEILYHTNSENNGKSGKVMFIGNSLKSGTNMLEENLGTPDKDTRFIVSLNDGTVINDVREVQLRKL